MKYVNLKPLNEGQSNNKGSSYNKLIISLVVGILLIVGYLVVFSGKVSALFNPVNIVANFKKIELNETDGRTNVLILGTDGRTIGNIKSKLTDTLMVVSIGRTNKDVVLISIPRDLWTQSSDGSYQGKINSMYSYGGIEEIKSVIENYLGIPIHYYGVTGFELFKDAVDIVGGIEVNVEHSFTDYEYPIEGREDAPIEERYETVHFEAGTQKMNGDTALKYVRSRKSANMEEGTDFARSKRQQNVIIALKNKVLSVEFLLNPIKIKELYETYAKNVETNVDLNSAQSFAILLKDFDFTNVKSLIMDDRNDPAMGGLLYVPENRDLYGGAYVLIPKHGNFDQIHAFVQRYLFGEN